jgi:phosphodiesterase/alkaline phosphatase D-like protein
MRFLRTVTSPSPDRLQRASWLAPSGPAAMALAALAALALSAALTLVPGGARSVGVPQPRTAPGRAAELPTSALGVVSSALGADARSYRVGRAGAALLAANPRQGLRVRFARSGVTIAAGGARVRLGAARLGAGAAAGALPRARANTVTYSAPGLTAWYRNGPLGLEQGFTVARAPAGASAGTLTIAIPLAGNTIASLAGHGAIVFSRAGAPALRYGDLLATDAHGRALRTSIALRRGAILLRVGVAGASYPLSVDPLVQQGPKLTGGEASGKADFGLSVAISGNGETVLVGGPSDNNAVGAAWVFTRSGSTWSQQGPKLTGSGEVGEAQFGYTVAISEDGNTALIGAGKDNGVGAVWVFTRSGSSWTQQGSKLTAAEEVGEGHFGCCGLALSADGNTALIGGYGDSTNVGAAWVFTRSGSTWSQQGAKLTAGDETGAGKFGYAVALSGDGDTALVGGGADNKNVGAAWVFTRSGSTWTQQGSKLTGSGETGAGQLGYAVALSAEGNTALLGAGADHSGLGAAFTFTRSGSTWTQLGSKLTAAEETGAGHFGCCGVALSGNGQRALIGGYEDGTGAGAAWLYRLSGSAWVQSGSKIAGGEELGAASFGRSLGLAANGSAAVIGGPFDDEFVGAAWMFVLHGVPAVATEAATSVGQTSATLNASVTPEGEAVTDCHFEYGTSEAYGSSAPCSPSPGGGISPVAVSASLAGLSPGTTYHYRVLATNPTGTSVGSDVAFTTPASSAPAVSTEPATAVAQTTATLNATVDPEDEAVSDCHFEYGTSEAYGSSAPCSPSPGGGISAVSVSASVTGLSSSTAYHYRVVATNPTGTSNSSDGTFTTPASQPPAVTTEPASAVAQTSATLNATVDPEDETVTDCHFEYGTSESYGSSAPCSPSPGGGTGTVAVSASLTGLSSGTTYHYRVTATNATGTSHSSDGTFTTASSQPPAVVTEPASPVTQSTATLNATVDPEDETVSDCHFEYGTSESYGSVPCSPSPGGGTSAVAVSAHIEGLTPETTYHFRVVATNPTGTSTGADRSFTTPALAPVAVTTQASRIGQTSAVLAGTVDPEGHAVTDCHLEYGTSESYGTSAPCNPSPGSGTSPVSVSAAVSGLLPASTYHYRIVAIGPGGTGYGADAQFATPGTEYPELGRCVTLTKATGRFKSSACTAISTGENTGKYEWVPWPAVKNGFSGSFTAASPTTFETLHKSTIRCTAGSLTGEFDGPKHASMAITLTGCEATKTLTGKCHSAAAAEGEVRFEPAQAVLGQVKAGTTPIDGWDVQPATGPVLAQMTCGASALTLEGSVIETVTTLDKMSTSFTLKAKGAAGKETYEKFENGIKAGLELQTPGGEEATSQTDSVIPANEEPVAIKALV